MFSLTSLYVVSILLLINKLISNVLCNQDLVYANLNLTRISKLNRNLENIFYSSAAIFSTSSLQVAVHGALVLAINNNLTFYDTTGCSVYENTNKYGSYVALVEQGHCDFDKQIDIAIKSKAAALIVISSSSDIVRMVTKSRNFVSIMISDVIGARMIDLLNQSLEVNISIIPQDSSQFRELSTTSLAFIIVGSVLVVLLVSGMWAIFYKIQKARRIEERQRLAEIMYKLTKRAISKMKYKRLRYGDSELKSGEVCAICLENYKINDVIRKLPCLNEIDTWLFENQSCPICKIDILKAYGLDIKTSSGFFRRQLERFNIVQSPLEISEAILSQAESRRNTLYSRRSSQTAISTISDTFYPIHRDSLFYGERQVDFNLSSGGGDSELNNIQNEVDNNEKPRTGRRLTFYNDKIENAKKENATTDDATTTTTNNNNNNNDKPPASVITSSTTTEVQAPEAPKVVMPNHPKIQIIIQDYDEEKANLERYRQQQPIYRPREPPSLFKMTILPTIYSCNSFSTEYLQNENNSNNSNSNEYLLDVNKRVKSQDSLIQKSISRENLPIVFVQDFDDMLEYQENIPEENEESQPIQIEIKNSKKSLKSLTNLNENGPESSTTPTPTTTATAVKQEQQQENESNEISKEPVLFCLNDYQQEENDTLPPPTQPQPQPTLSQPESSTKIENI